MTDHMRIYNTRTRSIEEFRTVRDGVAAVYSCGPTVYHHQHLGNMRAAVFADTLHRTLKAAGYEVKHVINITDVGHLTSDGDTGEDKLEKGAKREGKTVWEIAKMYTEAYFADLTALNVPLSDYLFPRATDHIEEQIALVRELEKKGYTYLISDGVYFDTSKFSRYAEFAHLDVEGLQAGARVEENEEKRNPTDFALWKFSPADEQRQMEWDSPWGRGFPGWHIECSAMGRKLLGQPFDVHCGGVDHIPIHHMNEIAQSEAAYGKPLAAFWLHGAFLTVDQKRMGKSEGNLVTVDEFMQRGVDSLAYRYLVLGAHYRSPLNFTWESLAGAQSALEHLREMCRALPKLKRESGIRNQKSGMIERISTAFDDDLDTPKALAILWDSCKPQVASRKPDELSAIIAYADQVFGLDLTKYLGKPLRIPREVQRLVAAREDARQRKDWARSDVLRAQVEALGFQVEDTKEGPFIRVVRKT